MNHRRTWHLQGVPNLRDLGGYACKGGVTRWGVFYRSAKLNAATQQDTAQLATMGIQTVLDLRYPDEAAAEPDRLPPGAACTNISLMGPVAAHEIAVNSNARDTRTLLRMYRQLLEHARPQLLEALRLLAHCEGPALYHCAAGKDRTGVLTMFLLDALGVHHRDIVADYEVSRGYIEGFTADISGSHHSNMARLLAWLEEKYGGPAAFLQQIGFAEADKKALVSKFCQPD